MYEKKEKKTKQIVVTISQPVYAMDSETTAHRIMRKGKRGAAAFINDEMISNGEPSENLTALLRTILDPDSQIDDTENIDWCKWIIAGGRTLSDFAATGK